MNVFTSFCAVEIDDLSYIYFQLPAFVHVHYSLHILVANLLVLVLLEYQKKMLETLLELAKINRKNNNKHNDNLRLLLLLTMMRLSLLMLRIYRVKLRLRILKMKLVIRKKKRPWTEIKIFHQHQNSKQNKATLWKVTFPSDLPLQRNQ